MLTVIINKNGKITSHVVSGYLCNLITQYYNYCDDNGMRDMITWKTYPNHVRIEIAHPEGIILIDAYQSNKNVETIVEETFS